MIMELRMFLFSFLFRLTLPLALYYLVRRRYIGRELPLSSSPIPLFFQYDDAALFVNGRRASSWEEPMRETKVVRVA